MSLDFSSFESGEKISIAYTIYATIGVNRESDTTEVNTTVDTDEGVNSAGALRWNAGKTGVGVVRPNGQVFDGEGRKIGVDAEVTSLEDEK